MLHSSYAFKRPCMQFLDNFLARGEVVPTLRWAGMALSMLLGSCTCIAQENAPSAPVAVPQITIPSYPDTTRGLELR